MTKQSAVRPQTSWLRLRSRAGKLLACIRHSASVIALLLLWAIAAHPALASNTLVTAGSPVAVARSSLTVTPDREWNRMDARPGRNSESWTIDGDGLNELNFYGGIENDHTLFREASKRTKPLPHFAATMLLSDIPALFEASYRIALDTPVMSVDAIEPATFLGHKAVRFRFAYSRQNEELRRSGEAVAAIVDGRLFLISFEAPRLFYYDRDLPAYRAIVAQARIAR